MYAKNKKLSKLILRFTNILTKTKIDLYKSTQVQATKIIAKNPTNNLVNSTFI